MTTIAVGIVVGEQGVLVARRPAGKPLAGMLEFPGGKVKPDESPDAALRRELREEIGIEVAAAIPFDFAHFQYPHGEVLLLFYLVRASASAPAIALENNPIQWMAESALNPSEFPPANAPVIAKLQAGLHRHAAFDAG